MRANLLLTVVIALGVWTVGVPDAVGGTFRVIRTIDFPYESSYGLDLAWDGEYLWTSRIFGAPSPWTTFAIDPSDGSVVASFEYTGQRGGIAWDGTSLWVSQYGSLWGDPVPVPLPDFMLRLSGDGTVITSLEVPDSPDSVLSGVTWDGTSLWIADAEQRKITQIDPITGSAITSFSSPGPAPTGLTWDGAWLWNVDGLDRVVYQMDTQGNVFDTYPWPLPESGPVHPSGITYDGQYFWLLDNSFEDVKFVQVAVPEPSTLGLFAIAVFLLGGWAFVRRHR